MKNIVLQLFSCVLFIVMLSSCGRAVSQKAELLYKFKDGSRDTVTVDLKPEGNHLSLHLTQEELSGIETLAILPEFARAEGGEDGYWLFPNGMATRFKEGRNGRYSCHRRHPLPILGYNTPRGFYMGYVRNYRYDVAHISKAENNIYTFSTELRLKDIEPYEDFTMEFYPLKGDEASYSGMGRFYRKMQMKAGRLKPLKDKVKKRPELKYAVEHPEVRIRQAWKPVPTPVLEQTPETEPALRVKVTFRRVMEIIDEMKKQGVDGAELCLVGWNLKGHDGRFPTHLPPEPELGGEKGLRELIKYAQSNGFQIVPHIGTGDAYRVSADFDEADIAKRPDGTLRTQFAYGSGNMYDLCYKVSYEKFLPALLDSLVDLGFRGLLYNDVYSITPPTVCYDPAHPVNSKEAQMWGHKTLEDGARKLGGIASEGGYDHLCDILDYCLYTIMAFDYDTIGKKPMRDEYFPIWNIVYNGSILCCPVSNCINYTVKDAPTAMKQLEYGGHPTFYFYSAHRDDNANWMGGKTAAGISGDLYCETPEQLSEAVAAIKKGCDFLDEYAYLHYEFMDDHRELAPGVFQTTWSGGTRLICNYSDGVYLADGVEIQPMEYRYFPVRAKGRW